MQMDLDKWLDVSDRFTKWVISVLDCLLFKKLIVKAIYIKEIKSINQKNN